MAVKIDEITQFLKIVEPYRNPVLEYKGYKAASVISQADPPYAEVYL